ncbi:MAG: hypothetical protein H6662_15610 [Ardenticatenaceae bacterium]|nr:hypothetical protein [Anaerolineales bacterium]MCB8923014.1 hypothetical protein [Ardenticatenaceae bacterium]
MNPLATAVLNRQRRQAEDVMMDAGRVLTRSADSTDSHNRPTYTYTAGDELACGVKVARNRQATDAEGNVVLVDYQIRLPHGTAVTANDRFRITSRYGTAAAEVDCEILGAVRLGATAVVINVKEITHG